MNDISFEHIEVVKDQLPFQVSITKNEQEDLMLMMEDVADGVYFDSYEVFFSQGTFYCPAKEQIPILEQITELGMEDHQLPIRHDQADVFLSEVLPSLKKVGEVEVSDTVEEEIIQVPLRAKLYLEVKEDLIVGKLEYHYSHYEIDPFNGREERSEEHTSELQSRGHLVCRLLLEKK